MEFYKHTFTGFAMFICKQNFYLNVIIRMTIGVPGDVHGLVDSSLTTANHEPRAQQKRANASLIM